MNEEKTKQVQAALKLTLQGVFLNFILAAVKGITGYLGHSQALIADAIESLTDVVSSLVVFGGMRIGAKPPDKNHPYGHGKYEPMAAVVVSLFLLGASIWILVESVHQIRVPHEAPHFFTLPILLVVIATKWQLSKRVNRASLRLSSLSLRGDALHHESDALTSFAALMGISIAIMGGYETADDYAALFASGIIALSAYRILRPAFHELSDRAPSNNLDEQAKLVARSVSGVQGLDKCFVRKMGVLYYIDLHVIVDGQMSVREGHSIAHKVESAIQAALPEVAEVLVHIEPTK